MSARAKIRVDISAQQLARLIELPPPTDEQAAVIESPPGPAVVIAGAGSGKTETMAARVVWLVANGHVQPDCVLGLTFTRKAATELGVRIRRRLRRWAHHADRDQRAELLVAEPTVLTYAAYSARLVADHGLRLGMEPSTRLISPAVAWQLADSVVRRHTGELPEDIGTPASVVGYVLRLAGELSDHLVEPSEVEAYAERVMKYIDALPTGPRTTSIYPGELAKLVTTMGHRSQLLPLVERFAQLKRDRGAVDFSDQMVWAARLAQLPEVRAAEREKYRAVLLDEYQDTGHAQIQLLRGLFDGGHPVTAVGDPFQSIYSWRGASAGNIGRFADTFRRGDAAPAPTFALSTSWRNDRSILVAANAVAQPLRCVHAGTIALTPSPAAATGIVVAAHLNTVEEEALWVSERLRQAWDEAARANPQAPRTAAVLVRRRSSIQLLAAALQAAGLPIEIVGLGGLLTTPEVIDVVATLHVLADYSSGAALLRLLTGARWRIGPRDLLALSRRARELARDATDPQPRDPGSIVEALDDLGERSRYSEQGAARMSRLAQELHRLRRRISAPLPELVAEVERVIGVDVEVAARADRNLTGRVHLDRFLDAASSFAADSDQATLGAFLAYLTAAEDEENGLEAGEIEVEPERVQILTVHGAKGLEWDIVAVPGLVEAVFPAAPKGNDWTRARHLLPFPLRGDAADLPTLDIFGAAHRRELAGWIKATSQADPPEDHDSKVKARHELDERRLAYVAFTRARHTLLGSGYIWDDAKKPRAVSPYLTALTALTAHADRAHAERDTWVEYAEGDVNPHDEQLRTAPWPYDPLGERRAAVEQGAALVRAALEQSALEQPALERPALSHPALELPQSGRPDKPGSPHISADDELRVAEWNRDVTTLLAERAERAPTQVQPVELPHRLSVSQLVTLSEDPQELARRLHRPMPLRPAPSARRGTAFHLWLERRWGGQQLIDLDELPGAADESATNDEDLLALREAFLASEWAQRTPYEVEVPFDMVFDGVVVRGRMDAVFSEPRPDGSAGWLVVDWKTGAVPSGRHAQSVAVQLAAYRLAWQRIISTPARPVELADVGAAFHYVRSGTTVAPADLLDGHGLAALIGG